MTDVNVTEKAREAALERWALGSSDTTQMLMAVDAALAALRSPDVVAGIAGVLWRAERWPEADAPESWDAAVVEAEQWPDGYWAVRVRRIQTQARAVVDWLTGGAR